LVNFKGVIDKTYNFKGVIAYLLYLFLMIDIRVILKKGLIIDGICMDYNITLNFVNKTAIFLY